MRTSWDAPSLCKWSFANGTAFVPMPTSPLFNILILSVAFVVNIIAVFSQFSKNAFWFPSLPTSKPLPNPAVVVPSVYFVATLVEIVSACPWNLACGTSVPNPIFPFPKIEIQVKKSGFPDVSCRDILKSPCEFSIRQSADASLPNKPVPLTKSIFGFRVPVSLSTIRSVAYCPLISNCDCGSVVPIPTNPLIIFVSKLAK